MDTSDTQSGERVLRNVTVMVSSEKENDTAGVLNGP